mgnify:CR=1 FL=1
MLIDDESGKGCATTLKTSFDSKFIGLSKVKVIDGGILIFLAT